MGYTAFGTPNATGTTVNIKQRYTYTGREKTTDPSLMYYRWRMYAPTLGRFTARDPIGYRGGINIYSYVRDMPTISNDPYGLITLIEKEIDTGRIGLLLLWVRIKINVKIDMNLAVTLEEDCPTIAWPTSFSTDANINTYDNSEDDDERMAVGVDAWAGIFGSPGDFKVKAGYRFGVSTSGDNILKRMWNFSIDAGPYTESSGSAQKWFEEIKVGGTTFKCVCATLSHSEDYEIKSGFYSTRLAAAYALSRIPLPRGLPQSPPLPVPGF